MAEALLNLLQPVGLNRQPVDSDDSELTWHGDGKLLPTCWWPAWQDLVLAGQLEWVNPLMHYHIREDLKDQSLSAHAEGCKASSHCCYTGP